MSRGICRSRFKLIYSTVRGHVRAGEATNKGIGALGAPELNGAETAQIKKLGRTARVKKTGGSERHARKETGGGGGKRPDGPAAQLKKLAAR